MLGPAGLSSDSGLGGSTDGSTDILVFGSVVDSVTEEGKCAFGLMEEYHPVFLHPVTFSVFHGFFKIMLTAPTKTVKIKQ